MGYRRINTTNPVSGIIGYWTATPKSSLALNSSNNISVVPLINTVNDLVEVSPMAQSFASAWYVSFSGSLNFNDIVSSLGLRPVITISKSDIQ